MAHSWPIEIYPLRWQILVLCSSSTHQPVGCLLKAALAAGLSVKLTGLISWVKSQNSEKKHCVALIISCIEAPKNVLGMLRLFILLMWWLTWYTGLAAWGRQITCLREVSGLDIAYDIPGITRLRRIQPSRQDCIQKSSIKSPSNTEMRNSWRLGCTTLRGKPDRSQRDQDLL